VHEVRIAGAGAVDSFSSGRVEAGPRDVIRFVAGDHRTHALAFLTDSLPAAAREYLESSRQLRGPPLVTEGAAWIVSLDGAPPGRYPFYCRSHGARGVVTVRTDR
jgi:plastocyanin